MSSKQIVVPLDEEHKTFIEESAKILGLNSSAFLRESAILRGLSLAVHKEQKTRLPQLEKFSDELNQEENHL